MGVLLTPGLHVVTLAVGLAIDCRHHLGLQLLSLDPADSQGLPQLLLVDLPLRMSRDEPVPQKLLPVPKPPVGVDPPDELTISVGPEVVGENLAEPDRVQSNFPAAIDQAQRTGPPRKRPWDERASAADRLRGSVRSGVLTWPPPLPALQPRQQTVSGSAIVPATRQAGQITSRMPPSPMRFPGRETLTRPDPLQSSHCLSIRGEPHASIAQAQRPGPPREALNFPESPMASRVSSIARIGGSDNT